MRAAVFLGLAAVLLLSACGGDPVPTPTPTKTPAPPTAAPASPTPASTPAPAPTAELPQSSPTPGAFAATVAAGAVRAVADDAVGFVLERGAENVTATQLTAAVLGVLGRLRDWTEGTGGGTALADCRALLPGVIARADNKGPLRELLAACEGGDAQQVRAALGAFAEIMP